MRTEPGFSGAPVLDVVSKRVVGIVAYGRQDSGVHFLTSTARIHAAFGRELASAPCRPAAAF